MARYSVHIETGREGDCMAHVAELVGCFAVGSSVEEALSNLREEIPRHLDWLEGQGELLERPPGPIELKVVEEVRSSARVSGDLEGPPADFFSHDALELTSDDLNMALRLMERGRQDLIDFLRDAPGELLEWRPSPEEQSISSLLLHIADSEATYLARLEEEDVPHPLMSAVRGWVYHRLSRLGEGDRHRIMSHDGQRWSARKVLRRILEHEREHTAQIRALVTRYGSERQN